jgi:hypothetical protein
MAISDFHDFFVAAAGVHGALLGLLFVAVSVSNWQDHFVASYTLAGLALLALADTLFTSLLALIRGAPFGYQSASLAAGFAALTAYLVWSTRKLDDRSRWRKVRFVGLFLFVGLIIQLSRSIVLGVTPSSAESARYVAYSIIVVDLAAIIAAWFLLIEQQSWSDSAPPRPSGLTEP